MFGDQNPAQFFWNIRLADSSLKMVQIGNDNNDQNAAGKFLTNDLVIFCP